MPEMLIPDGYAYVRWHFLVGGTEEAYITCGVENTLGVSAASIAASAVAVAVFANWESYISADRSIDKVLVKSNQGGVLTLAEDNVGIPGVATGAALPANTAVLMKKFTGIVGREQQGRWYWPYIAEAAVDNNGVIDGSTKSQFQTVADDTLSQMATLDIPMVVLHSNALVDPTLVSNLIVDGRVATQRRRLR